MKKTHAPDRPAAYIQRGYIKSALGPRPFALTSLRPGDWLRRQGLTRTLDCVVLQASAVLCRVELRWPDGVCDSLSHDSLQSGWTYLGTGRRRSWWRMLPKWLRGRVCRYAKPEGAL
jgi:hypothetical protein